jgi:hypothetical protein
VAGTEVEIEVGGRVVRVSHPEKVFFPTNGETKLDLVNYYLSVGDAFLRTMRDRPTLMQRFPEGAAGKSFFQKRVPAGIPDWLQTTVVTTPNGTTSNALVMADLAHTVWAVNIGCLGFHPWPYRAHDPGHTDELRIDLDPSPGITFEDVRHAAHSPVRCSTSSVWPVPEDHRQPGAPRAAVCVPNGFVRRALGGGGFARSLERRHPDHVTAAVEGGAPARIHRLQPERPHKTVFGVVGAGPRRSGVDTVPLGRARRDPSRPPDARPRFPRLADRGDPWQGMNDAPQSLEPLLALHERDRAAGLHDGPWPPVYPKMPDEPDRVAPSRARQKPDADEK